MSLVGFYRPILTLSMRAFGPRNSAYAFWNTTDIPTDRPTYIYHAKSRLNTPVWGSLRSPNDKNDAVANKNAGGGNMYVIIIGLTVWMKTGWILRLLRRLCVGEDRQIQFKSAANKLAQDSDVYRGSAFAEFSGSCSFLIRFSSQLEGAHFCHCYHDG